MVGSGCEFFFNFYLETGLNERIAAQLLANNKIIINAKKSLIHIYFGIKVLRLVIFSSHVYNSAVREK